MESFPILGWKHLSPREHMALRVKHFDHCSECLGIRYSASGERCKCLDAYNNEYEQICANLPAKYIGLEFNDIKDNDFVAKNNETFKIIKNYISDLKNMKQTGAGIYFWGESGAGKSYLASRILKKALKQGYSAYFVSLENLVRANFKSRSEPKYDEYLETLERDIDFLVIDEIDKMPNDSKPSLSFFETFLKNRYHSKKCLITTANSSREDMHLNGDNIGLRGVLADLMDAPIIGNHRGIDENI